MQHTSEFLPTIPDTRIGMKKVTIVYSSDMSYYSYAMAWYLAYQLKESHPRIVKASHSLSTAAEIDHVGRTIIFVDMCLPYKEMAKMIQEADVLLIGRNIADRRDVRHLPFKPAATWVDYVKSIRGEHHAHPSSLYVMSDSMPVWMLIDRFFEVPSYNQIVNEHLEWAFYQDNARKPSEQNIPLTATIQSLHWKPKTDALYSAVYHNGPAAALTVGADAYPVLINHLVDECVQSLKTFVPVQINDTRVIAEACMTIPSLVISVARRLSNNRGSRGIGFAFYEDAYGRHVTVVSSPTSGIDAASIAERFGGSGNNYIAMFTIPHGTNLPQMG